MRKRQFIITGLCNPSYDYMVNIDDKVDAVMEMVDSGQYFTVNRPRQYGKTTLLNTLSNRISNIYICIFISLEGIGDESFKDEKSFCLAFIHLIHKALKNSPAGYDISYINAWNDKHTVNFLLLGNHITKMCSGKKVVLIIDEVDKTSDNRIFIHFLGLLRDKFLFQKDGIDNTFHSVILAGVYDIRNIKLKLIGEGVSQSTAQYGRLLNSPWNIAVPFTLDMSFNANDIAGMLYEYESDRATGMDVVEVAECIYEYTGGYPFLVSQLCRMLDIETALNKDWSPRGVRQAVKMLVNQNPLNTLFDDISKNLETYCDLYRFIYAILITGQQKSFTVSNPVIQMADMFGIIKNRDGVAIISNRIFEIFITDYFISKDSLSEKSNRLVGYKNDIVNAAGRFDMELCLKKFAALFRELFTDKDKPFVEEHGRMLFLTYLMPLINGGGFYHIESRLSDQRRMDLVVDFGADQFIIELKLWYGESSHEKAYAQLAEYLKVKGVNVGYLLTFDFRKDKSRAPKAEWVEWGGSRIFDVIV